MVIDQWPHLRRMDNSRDLSHELTTIDMRPRGIQRLIVALPGTRSDLLKRKLTAVISLTVPN